MKKAITVKEELVMHLESLRKPLTTIAKNHSKLGILTD